MQATRSLPNVISSEVPNRRQTSTTRRLEEFEELENSYPHPGLYLEIVAIVGIDCTASVAGGFEATLETPNQILKIRLWAKT
jgi:hypothetical protein